MFAPSVYLLMPKTDEAKAWLDENVQAESWQYLGKNLAVGHRYIQDICRGICEAGLQDQFDVTT